MDSGAGAYEEDRRISTLKSLAILDSAPELEFDSIAELARNISGAQVALVSLVAEERLWFKARIGLDTSETPRHGAFCAHAILDDGVLCVRDATGDSRFRANPLVTASPHVRSYIGAPIVVRGQRLGTVCALSSTPRSFDEAIREQFRHLAVIVAERLVLRHRTSFITGLTKTTSDAVIATDKDQNITYWGGGAERMFGFTSDEALQMKLDALMPERVKAAHNAGFERFRRTEQSRMVGRSVELPAQHRSGAEFPIDLNVTIWREGESMMIGGIVRDATERRSLAEARIVNEAQSRFLANMSHEIRTPLNGVLGIAQVLEASGLSEAQRSMVEIIKDSAGSLNTLLSDILLSARLESGETIVHSDEFEVGGTISKAVAVHHAAATTKGLRLVWSQLDSEAWVIGDQVKLSQIIANLLSNAIKFTETGEVRIWTEREGHLWKIYVSDTGIGFSEDQQQRIFVRFHQIDNSSARRYGGSGLGLSISRQLAVAMGGELSASSQLGVGSTFCLTLPLPARGAVTPAVAAHDAQG